MSRIIVPIELPLNDDLIDVLRKGAPMKAIVLFVFLLDLGLPNRDDILIAPYDLIDEKPGFVIVNLLELELLVPFLLSLLPPLLLESEID